MYLKVNFLWLFIIIFTSINAQTNTEMVNELLTHLDKTPNITKLDDILSDTQRIVEYKIATRYEIFEYIKDFLAMYSDVELVVDTKRTFGHWYSVYKLYPNCHLELRFSEETDILTIKYNL